ncbi:FHA domain-containing protein [Chloroflexota bacterium]
MAQPPAPSLTLVVRHTGQVFPLTRATITIGRDPENIVVVSDPLASRYHATIFWDSGEYLIQDVGSANGTYLNERPIVGPRSMHHGDLLRVGHTAFDVQLTQGAGAVPDRATLAEDVALSRSAQQRATVTSLPATYPTRRRSRVSPWPILFGLLVVGLVVGCSVIAFTLLFPSLPWAQPMAGIQAPAENARIAIGNEISLRASATSGGAGDMIRLDLYLDSVLVATATSVEPGGQSSLIITQPWVFDLLGSHTLSAVAYTAGGKTSQPVFRNFTVVDLAAATPTGQPTSPAPTNTPTPVPPTATQAPTEAPSPTATPSGPPKPQIEFFRANPEAIVPGECATLEWGAVTQATAAFIDQDIGGVGTPGRHSVCPSETTTYTLTAQGPGGVVTAQTTVTVSH